MYLKLDFLSPYLVGWSSLCMYRFKAQSPNVFTTQLQQCFFAMFTFQVDNTKKSQVNIPAPHCLNGSCRYVPPQSLWQQCPAKWIAMSWVHFATHTRPADLLLPDDYSDYTRVHDMNDSLLLPANDIMWANVYETNLHKVFYPIV